MGPRHEEKGRENLGDTEEIGVSGERNPGVGMGRPLPWRGVAGSMF